jgi:hypothetical protein
VAVALSSGCGTLETQSGQVGASGHIVVDGIRSGENTLTVRALDGVGLKQVVGSTFSWTVQLTSDILDVNITSGPPLVSARRMATFQFLAHSNGTLKTSEAIFEVKEDELDWSVACQGLNAAARVCSYSPKGLLALGPHEVRIRAKDNVTGVIGSSAVWAWTVAECKEEEYAVVANDGALMSCEDCPAGGNCAATDTTAQTLLALKDWWAPQTSRLTLYRCPFQGACMGGVGSNVSVCNSEHGFRNSTLCGECKFNHVRRGDSCTKCPMHGIKFIFFAFVLY